MPDVLRIKRRLQGGASGSPSGLYNAELAYSEVDDILYYGKGLTGGNLAVAPIALAGQGLAYTATPAVNSGVGGPGTSGLWARGDHFHPPDPSKANNNNATFTGTTTILGTMGGTAVTALLASPGAIGGTTAGAGSFTTLSASAAVSGTGFTNLFASPPAIGATAAGTGSFTNLTVSGALSGTGLTGMFSAPGPIGSVTPSSGAFTTLSASSAVSGNGFISYLAAPPAIGGTTPAAGTFTNLTVNGTLSGAGLTAAHASPGPIGNTAASSGAFTTLSASGAVSGTGFNNLFASPPAIGSTAPSTGAFTNLSVTGTLSGAGATGLLTGYAKIDSQTFTGNVVLPLTTTMLSSPANTVNSTVLATTAYVRLTRLDQFAIPTATVNMNNQVVSNVLQGTAGTDVATRAYVDANSAGLVSKTAAAVATVANITLSGLQTIDGYTTVAGDRVLVKDQTSSAANGIYVAGAGTWPRATDMDNWTEVPQAYVFVSNGTVNAASSWVCQALPGGTLETTPVVWAKFSQTAQVTAGGGLTRTGNTFDVVGTLNRIVVNADNIDIDINYVGQASITTLGNITGSAAWNATTIAIARGGTGVTSLPTGYVQSNGTVLSTVAQVPVAGVSGLGSMASQNANAVAITGGTLGGTPGVTWDLGTF